MNYRIITHDSNAGYKNQTQYNTRRFAENAAEEYLNHHETVYLMREHVLDKVYDKENPQGRKPYTYEILNLRMK